MQRRHQSQENYREKPKVEYGSRGNVSTIPKHVLGVSNDPSLQVSDFRKARKQHRENNSFGGTSMVLRYSCRRKGTGKGVQDS